MTWNRTDFDRLATLFEPIWRETDPSGMRGYAPYSGYNPEIREAPNGDTKQCPECEGSGCDEPRHKGFKGPETSEADLNCMGSCYLCLGSGRVPNADAEGMCKACDGGKRRSGHLVGMPSCSACNGSGRTPAKRYLHVADKYTDAPDWAREYHDRAYAQACRVADALGVPAAFYPRPSVGALRVVDYPPGAGTVEHTDFDLLTVNLWRSHPEDLLCTTRLGAHVGEIGALVGLGPADRHSVPPRPYRQCALIYFALPSGSAVLPSGETVSAWVAERSSRSRH